MAATAAAMFATQRVRRYGLLLDRVKVVHAFSPDADGDFDTAPIKFRITRSDVVDADIVDSSGRRTLRLVDSRRVRRNTVQRFIWDGLEEDGDPAPQGAYSLRIEFHHRDRTITPSEKIALVRGSELFGEPTLFPGPS